MIEAVSTQISKGNASYKLGSEFYLHPDVIQISQEILGKVLITNLNNDGITGGIITEAEAYRGPEDRASHAFNNRRTPRTEVMFAKGGISYVYICYGMHHLFNVITNVEGIPHAVLIRAVKPVIGIDIMMQRRNKLKVNGKFSGGPGTLSQALGINKEHSGLSLQGENIWIEDRNLTLAKSDIIAGPRVGVESAGEDAHRPWRFRISKDKLQSIKI